MACREGLYLLTKNRTQAASHLASQEFSLDMKSLKREKEMGYDLSALTFVPDLHDFGEHNEDVVTRIPSHISDRSELFDILARDLDFPDYFGRNWDALYDLLCDFSWIQQRRIVIIHHDLPIDLGEKDSRIYLQILRDAAKDWKPEENHECERTSMIKREVEPCSP